ncbi:MAG: hypothetical protein ACM36C_17910 [Acidobacteriota bacterium]
MVLTVGSDGWLVGFVVRRFTRRAEVVAEPTAPLQNDALSDRFDDELRDLD